MGGIESLRRERHQDKMDIATTASQTTLNNYNKSYQQKENVIPHMQNMSINTATVVRENSLENQSQNSIELSPSFQYSR